MSRYILDTDILTLYQEGHPAVRARVAVCRPEDLAITIIPCLGTRLINQFWACFLMDICIAQACFEEKRTYFQIFLTSTGALAIILSSGPPRAAQRTIVRGTRGKAGT